MSEHLHELLQAVRDGSVSVEQAELELKKAPFEDLGYAKIDFHRSLRQGAAEVIYGAGKTPAQIAGIAAAMREKGVEPILITRLSPEAAALVAKELPLDYRADAKLGIIGKLPKPDGDGTVVIAAAGTSDYPVAEEAALTAEVHGSRVLRLYDVGVAGLHRLLAHTDELMAARVVVAVAVSFVIMSFGIAGGIEKANKIMMPILFLLFVGLGIYVGTLPGASDGYRYIFTIKPAGLLDPYVWIYAFGQAFFSLSVAGNGSVIYGSYLSKSECIPSSARNVALFDTIAALLAAFVIIPAMAAGGAQLDAGGPGLMFIYLVHVMNGMAGGRIVAMVFFVCVAFAGVTSIINLYEAPVASLQERFGLKRVPATAVIHVIGLAVALCIQAIVSQWMDVVSIYICPLGALLAAVMFFWIGGKKLVLESVNLGARKPIGGWYYPLCKYVYCASVLVALVAGAALGGIG